MTVFERVRELAKSHSKTMKQVTLDLDYSENYFYSLKSGKQPSSKRLKEIANYFNVSTDYLLGNTDDSSHEEKIGESDDDLTEFFKAETEGMTSDEKATLEKEWKDYLIIRKRMMRGE